MLVQGSIVRTANAADAHFVLGAADVLARVHTLTRWTSVRIVNISEVTRFGTIQFRTFENYRKMPGISISPYLFSLIQFVLDIFTYHRRP